MSLPAPAPSGKRLAGLAPKGKAGALAPGAPPSFGGGMGLNPALVGAGPSFGSSSALLAGSGTGSSANLHGTNSTSQLQSKASAAKLAPVLPSLNLQQKKIDTSILDSDDYFGKHKDSQWGIPTTKPKAPETINALPSLGSARTPRSLPGMEKKPNTTLLDAQRPQALAAVPGGGSAAVDYNLLLANPLKPAFQGLGQQGAFDSALTARR